MDVERFLDELRSSPGYKDQIVHVHTVPARPGSTVPFPDELGDATRHFLRALGVQALYRHQADAIEAGLAGSDVLVTTGPASGKSLCYQVPMLEALVADPQATALLVFPTKALARDQMAAWNKGVDAAHAAADGFLTAVPFDADATRGDRQMARERARVLVTNPEMVHANLLVNHGRWARFLGGLRFIVLDEIHTYAGFFGANMANVIRRVSRVCTHYGARPQFICSSATVGNPKEMAERLTDRSLHHVDTDASRSGNRTYVLWNPPRIKRRKWRGRRSANVEAHELMIRLICQGIATICFTKARNSAELVYRYVREGLQKQAPALADRAIPYRGGYSPEERRDMERRLRDGEILGVSATRALELGIDVGTLDAAIVVGYPGVLNALFQQMGRAGRAGRDCLCVLVGTDTPINQYVMAHPEFVFERPIEHAVVDRDNPFVVLGHLRCAAAELPLHDADLEQFGYGARLALDVLEEAEKVRCVEGTWYHAAQEQPAHELRLRGYGDESTVVMDADTGKIIDRLDKFRSLRIFYPGAIYFRRGDTYAMLEHDTEQNVVTVRRVDVPYYTDPISGTAVEHVDVVLDRRPLGAGEACLGEVFAVLGTFCYERVHFYSLERIDRQPANVPNVAYEAMSFWLTPPAGLADEAARLGLNPASGMKGILYCTSRILPLFLTSDANDFDWSLGCRNSSPHAMFWYEFYLRGIGNSEQCYERLEEILALTLDHLLTCDCKDGCPNCTSRLITPYHVRNVELGEGTVESRRAAVVILNSVLTGDRAETSMALLDASRPRGMRHLPTVTGERRQKEPHRMPLDERTRRLLLRKVERARAPQLPVGHAIELAPPEGIPVTEDASTVHASDAERRAGHAAIRQTGDPLRRKLRKRLERGPSAPAQRESEAETPQPQDAPPAPPEAAPPNKGVVQLGDPIARLARARKRGR